MAKMQITSHGMPVTVEYRTINDLTPGRLRYISDQLSKLGGTLASVGAVTAVSAAIGIFLLNFILSTVKLRSFDRFETIAAPVIIQVTYNFLVITMKITPSP